APTIQAPEQKPPTLAQELSFLDGAQQAMRQGDSHRALMTLEEYEKTFPDGRTLDIEAHTLRIEALVKEGRVSEAKEAAARFLDIYPHSVLAARVVATLQAIGKEKP
ncbi:MAG TPA: outer membrane protein assembly factor BamD, partial [Polyangia bacterium]